MQRRDRPMRRQGGRRLGAVLLSGCLIAPAAVYVAAPAAAQTYVVDSTGWRVEDEGRSTSAAAAVAVAGAAAAAATPAPAAVDPWPQTIVIGGDGEAALDPASRDQPAAPADGPPRILGVSERTGPQGAELRVALSAASDFLFWSAEDGGQVTLFAPDAPMRAGARGAGGLIDAWRCVDGPAPGCAVQIDLTRPMTVAGMTLARPERAGGAYQVRLALIPRENARFARARTGVAWRGGGALPPLWPQVGGPAAASPVAAPQSRLEPVGRSIVAALQPVAPPAQPPISLDVSQEATAQVAAAGVDCRREPDACQDPAPWDADYLAGFYEGPWAMAKRPFDVSRDALIVDAIALGGFGLLYALDEDVRDEARDARSDGADAVFDAAEPMGRFYPLLAVGAGAWGLGEAVGDRSLQRVGLNGFQAVLIAAVPVEGTKALFGRSRPLKNQGNDDWFDEGNSFLSGHTTYAFAAASTIAHEYGGQAAWVPWVAYSAAGLVGAQRIYDDKHWASDVFVSALVGWGVGQAVADLDAFAEEGPMDVGALQTPGAQGVRLAVDF